MSKIAPKKLEKVEKEPLEIVVANYWPTKLLKFVKITVPGKDSWHNDITLNKKEAEYLYEHLKGILETKNSSETQQ